MDKIRSFILGPIVPTLLKFGRVHHSRTCEYHEWVGNDAAFQYITDCIASNIEIDLIYIHDEWRINRFRLSNAFINEFIDFIGWKHVSDNHALFTDAFVSRYGRFFDSYTWWAIATHSPRTEAFWNEHFDMIGKVNANPDPYNPEVLRFVHVLDSDVQFS